MKIKVIKRATSEKIIEDIPAAENNHPAKMDGRKIAETVKLWIDDLRQSANENVFR